MLRQSRLQTPLSFVVAAGILVLGLICLKLKPVWFEPVDCTATPFVGKHGGSAYALPSGGIAHTEGQRMAYRSGLGIVGIAVIGFFLRPKNDLTIHATGAIRVLRRWVFCNRWIATGLGALFIAAQIPSTQKIPDMTQCNDTAMWLTNSHLALVIGHADRLAANEVLFRDVTPLYGVLLPTLLAVWEQRFGLLTMGDSLRFMVGLELLYVAVAMYLFVAWARGRWVWAAMAILLMLPYYYSRGDCLIPPNHGPWRTLGISFGLLGLWCFREASSTRASWVGGGLAALAILTNVESGVATTLGITAYLVLRYASSNGRLMWKMVAQVASRAIAAGLVTLTLYVFGYALAFGAFPSPRGVAATWEYAKLGSSGFGSTPIKLFDFNATIWPVFLFLHAASALVYTVWSGEYGHRRAFRAAVATLSLVWFSYYFNRPDSEYICSYIFPYGFLLIDSLRTLVSAIRRPYSMNAGAAALAAVAVVFAGVRATESMNWSTNPAEWKVICRRWSVPLVERGAKPTQEGVRLSKVFVQPEYARKIHERADYLRTKSAGRKLIYFTADSYLMLRESGVYPRQEYIDAFEAVTQRRHLKLVKFVLRSCEPEIYFDTRSVLSTLPLGDPFQLLRADLTSHYRLDRVESGWEVWVRQQPSLAEAR